MRPQAVDALNVPAVAAILAALLVPVGAGAQPQGAAWEEATIVPALEGAARVFARDSMFLFGGIDADGQASDRIWVVGIENGTRTTALARLPTPRWDVVAVHDGLRVHLLGGRDARGALDEILVFDPGAGTIAAATSRLPEPRAGMLAAWVAPGALLFGGSCNACPVLAYDPRTETVTTHEALTPGIERGAALWDGQRVHLLGGHVAGAATATWRTYDPGRGTLETHAPLPRAWVGAGLYDGAHGYLLGSPTWRLDLRAMRAEAVAPAPPLPVEGATAMSSPWGLWIVGAGLAHDRTLRFDPAGMHVVATNAWCDVLAVDDCRIPEGARPSGFPLYPLAGAFLMALFMVAWGLPARQFARRALGRPGRAARILVAGSAVLALAVHAVPWAHYTLDGHRARAWVWGVQSNGFHPWWSSALDGLDGRALAVMGAILWTLAMAGAGVAATLLWKRGRGVGGAWLAAGAATGAWLLATWGIQRAAEGATAAWRGGPLLALVATMLWGLGAFLWMRDPSPIPPPGAPGATVDMPAPGAEPVRRRGS